MRRSPDCRAFGSGGRDKAVALSECCIPALVVHAGMRLTHWSHGGSTAMTANQDPQPEQGHKTWWWLVAAAGLVALIALGASLLKALPPREKRPPEGSLAPSGSSPASVENSSSPTEKYLDWFTYQLQVPDGRDLVQYEVELTTPAPGGDSGGGVRYTKRRFVAWSPAASHGADFTTSGTAALAVTQWRALESAIQTWVRAHKLAEVGIGHGESMMGTVFLGDPETISRMPRRWLYLDVQERIYDSSGEESLDNWVVVGGADQFAKARPLVEVINRALPTSVTKRFALPLPPAADTAARGKSKARH